MSQNSSVANPSNEGANYFANETEVGKGPPQQKTPQKQAFTT
jgi:hypothetical protein